MELRTGFKYFNYSGEEAFKLVIVADELHQTKEIESFVKHC